MASTATRQRWEKIGSHVLLVPFLLFALFLAIAALSTSGCSGKYPDQNSVYTTPGTYAYTLTATDGFLKHSATFQLKVSAN